MFFPSRELFKLSVHQLDPSFQMSYKKIFGRLSRCCFFIIIIARIGPFTDEITPSDLELKKIDMG